MVMQITEGWWEVRETLICSIHQSLWCQHPHHDRCYQGDISRVTEFLKMERSHLSECEQPLTGP